MALSAEAIHRATGRLMQAAALGSGWREALGELAHAADARGVILMRGGPDGGPVEVVTTPEIDEPCASYMAGDRPPDSRQQRVVVDMRRGFLADYDCYAPEEIGRDPFYQEFLRPRDFQWHACALLAGEMGSDIDISFKRGLSQGHFTSEEIAALDTALPDLRAIARFAGDRLDAMGEDALARANRRGEAAFLIDQSGRIRAHNRHAEPNGASVLTIVRGELRVADRLHQRALDAAIAAAQPRPAFVPLTDETGSRRFTLAVAPLAGEARFVFRSARAIATLVEHRRPAPLSEAFLEAFATCYGLTRAEQRVVELIGNGHEIGTVAARLSISPGTARNHVKAILRKTECRRQGELVMLLKELQTTVT